MPEQCVYQDISFNFLMNTIIETKSVESKEGFSSRAENASSIRRIWKEAKLVAMSKRIRLLEDALLAEGCTNDELLSSDASTSLEKSENASERADETTNPSEYGGTLGVTASKDNVFLGSVAVEVCPLSF